MPEVFYVQFRLANFVGLEGEQGAWVNVLLGKYGDQALHLEPLRLQPRSTVLSNFHLKAWFNT